VGSLPPVTRALLLSCVGVFGLQQLGLDDLLVELLALWPLRGGLFLAPFHLWQLVSYSFLHGSLLHLGLNMFALYMFGPEIERLLGRRRFITYWLTCVIGAAVMQLLVQLQAPAGSGGPTVGASGGMFGLLLAFGMAYPRRRLVLLFPPIPIPAWLFVTLYGLLELGMGISGSQSSVAHFAHLGGMAGGLLLILWWRFMATRAS
jgi:membrane associated rhomboid family serine protease